MKKIVSNVLVVSVQLIVGGLFLFMLFGKDDTADSKVVVVNNNNLDKMTDVISELFEADQVVKTVDDSKVEELVDAEQKRREEEAKAEAERLAKEKLKKEEENSKEDLLVSVDASGYKSIPALGFNVTTDNKVYELTEDEFKILAAVVSCEAKKNSKDDILAVMSVILNRADSKKYPNDPVSVVAAKNQFSCYKGKSITPSKLVESVMIDALNGVRNNKYRGFRSWQTTSYSDNYIVKGGNRYS